MVEILEGYRGRDGGSVTRSRRRSRASHPGWRARIGIVLQTCEMPAELTAGELVERFAGYYPHPRPVGETLELVGLGDRRDARAGTLSGGQRRRLDVAMALVGDPELLFLDEPTTGFDPSARHQAWSVISRLRTLGKTIVLTTHYMEEAEALADRVAVIVAGRIVAEGIPDIARRPRSGAGHHPVPASPPASTPSSCPSSPAAVSRSTTRPRRDRRRRSRLPGRAAGLGARPSRSTCPV